MDGTRLGLLFGLALSGWAVAPSSALPTEVQPDPAREPDAADLAPASLSRSSPVPIIFNAPRQARGGDIIGLQGANLDSSVEVYQENREASAQTLPIVTRVGAVWIAVQLPAILRDPVILRVRNRAGVSDPLRLNAALPRHLDATQLVPGGRMRLFGSSLLVAGSTPTVTVDDRPARVDLSASNEDMLVATVPPDAASNEQATVRVDNGNGTGTAALPVTVAVRPGSGDPLGLGAGWAAGFTSLTRVVSVTAACNGVADDTQSIKDAVEQASRQGGGIVLLPQGQCRLAGTVNLAPRVILRGAGQKATTLRYEANYPVYADGLDLVGLQDLCLQNAGPVQEGPVWRHNTRSVIQRVTFDLGVTRQVFFTGNTNFIFDRNTIRQTGSYDQQNPYRFDDSSGLVFSRNRSVNVSGSPTFRNIHDAAIIGKRFTRDASSQNESPVIAHHGLVLDFAYRIAVVGNTFDFVNGPVINKLRNDGETILVEGGGADRTENLGTVEAADATSLTDHGNVINADPFKTGTLPENYAVAIVSGPGMGQWRRLTGVGNGTLRVDRPWSVLPDRNSRYSTFVWGLQDALIKNNVLDGNPRGIWLYQTSIANVDVRNNHIGEGGGIYLRSYQNEAQKIFTFQVNCTIASNDIVNTTGRWLSHIIVANVSADSVAFGTGEIGIAVRRNRVVANVPNLTSTTEDHAADEGYRGLVFIENNDRRLGPAPNMLGTIFQHNVCENCEHPFVIGTGAFGTVVVDNRPAVTEPNALLDLETFNAGIGGATATFSR